MLVVVILANGLLQNIVQPIAFGATLDLNPLVVLIVTIGFGSIFGMLGMVLAAPLTSAALHISRELAAAKAPRRRPRERPPADRGRAGGRALMGTSPAGSTARRAIGTTAHPGERYGVRRQTLTI